MINCNINNPWTVRFFYDDSAIRKEKDGKRLYFDNEIDDIYNRSRNKSELIRLDSPRMEDENKKKIFSSSKMCEEVNWIHSKAHFATLIETDEEFIKDVDFSKFSSILNRIKIILAQP